MRRIRVGCLSWLTLIVTGRGFALLAQPFRVGERIQVLACGTGGEAAVEVIGIEDWGAEVVCPAWRYAVDYRMVERA